MIASGANGPITIIEQVQTPVEEEFSESDDDHSETNWPYRILPLLPQLEEDGVALEMDVFDLDGASEENYESDASMDSM